MLPIDSNTVWFIGEGRSPSLHTAAGLASTQRERKSVCVCLCVRGVKKTTPLTIAPGTFLFSKIMNRIDELNWNASLLRLYSLHCACDGWSRVGYWSQPIYLWFSLRLSKIWQYKQPTDPEGPKNKQAIIYEAEQNNTPIKFCTC